MATAEKTAGIVPPQNLEAEESVLGAMMVSEATIDPVMLDVRLLTGDFYRDRHRTIFEAIISLKEAAEPVDVLTVSEALTQSGQLEQVGGKDLVASLAAKVPAPGSARHYAKIVKQNALLRRLSAAAQEIKQSVDERGGEPSHLVENAERLLFQVAYQERAADFREIGEILEDEIDKLEQLAKGTADVTGTPSGFKEVDNLTGGFQPGNLIVMAGRPSMGKSAVICNIAENVAVKHGRPVALFSLEMSEMELSHRFIASQARISGDRLRKGRVSGKDWPNVVKACNSLGSAPLWIDDSSDLGMLELRAKARRLDAQERARGNDGLGLVIVDYIQLLRSDDSRANRVEQVGQFSRGLKILARELQVPVIGVSQLSRAPEQRPDKRPILSDLRESGCLTGDSLVHLPDEGRRVPIAELVGRSGFRVLALDPETWKLEPREVKGAFATGRKQTFRLTTGLGRTIRATANHKFRTIDGWKRLDELSTDDRIALPRELEGPAGHSVSEDEGAVMTKARMSRTRASRVGCVVRSDELLRLSVSDVYWDQVKSIQPDAAEEVYDLTVEGLHNFVADDIVVHNSIEQDADVVSFLYRDEYYNKESEEPGIAELIFAKHRNGPIGTIRLVFLEHYPKFADRAREEKPVEQSAGDGPPMQTLADEG